ncbi:MAG: DUF3344 domain-containing protein [Candidatus Lokiarchaeota archaeon]|nr:DUF3344 domain-containing protein [Candidatus Lokiarchaeota archaeon]
MIKNKIRLILIILIIALMLLTILNVFIFFSLIIRQTSETSYQLKLESLKLNLYEGSSYVYTDIQYQIQAKVTNIGSSSISGFQIKCYQNSTEINTGMAANLESGASIIINCSWIPDQIGIINLSTKILKADAELSNNFTLIEVNNISSTGYDGGSPITTKFNGIINGSLKYLMGNASQIDTYEWMSSNESYLLYYNLSSLGLTGDIHIARMHTFFSWSYTDPIPNLTVQVNQSSGPSNWLDIEVDNYYVDRKGFGSYDFPSGTLAYNLTNLFNLNDEIFINFTNYGSSFSIYGASIVLITNNSGTNNRIEYWINEGCDILAQKYYAPKNNPAYDPYAIIPFSQPKNPSQINESKLITLVPGGDKGLNSMMFNNFEQSGIYNTSNDHLVAINELNVKEYLSDTNNNVVRITDLGDYIVPSVAFLWTKY